MRAMIKKIGVYTWQWFYLHGFFPSLQNKAAIFMLHRMSSPNVIEQGHSPQFLNNALIYLKGKGYNFISLDNIFDHLENNKKLPKKSIAFSLDDGFEDQVKIAAPIFKKNNCPVNIFLITNSIDTGIAPWDSILKHIFIFTKKKELRLKVDNELLVFDLGSTTKKYDALREIREKCKECSELKLNKILRTLYIEADMEDLSFPISSAKPASWEDVKKIEGEYIYFSPHTKNHKILSNIDSEAARNEIVDSWSRLKEQLEYPSPVFAYPTGRKQDFSLRDINIIKSLGLSGALTTHPGYVDVEKMTEADKYLVNRMSFPSNMEDLIQVVSGLEYVKDEIRKLLYELKHHGKKYLISKMITQFKYKLGLYKKYENIDWNRVKRLVFVCKGNICRSPYAEIKAKNMGLNAISIGLDTKEGSPANESAIKNALYRGVNLKDHRARVYDSIEVSNSDLVICMEPWHIKLFKKFDNSDCQISLMGLMHSNKQVLISDPFGKLDIYFADAFQKIDNALINIKL